ncbi:MAG: hypothetical protein PHP51_03010 [Desulfotomaculaceae bacterium]|nr:hypothetical protein [Desulfotomaculaceae bacterium]MDD4766293.1 hypothetical protein [Desulfotomaculaceae bacterium]
MSFEVYKPRFEKEATVAISKNHLTLNKKLAEKFDTEYVELSFDKDTKTIRIKATDSKNGLILNKNKIGARGFFKHFNIQQKGKYNAVFDENEKAIYVKY